MKYVWLLISAALYISIWFHLADRQEEAIRCIAGMCAGLMYYVMDIRDVLEKK
jgi:hypothetical protein